MKLGYLSAFEGPKLAFWKVDAFIKALKLCRFEPENVLAFSILTTFLCQQGQYSYFIHNSFNVMLHHCCCDKFVLFAILKIEITVSLSGIEINALTLLVADRKGICMANEISLQQSIMFKTPMGTWPKFQQSHENRPVKQSSKIPVIVKYGEVTDAEYLFVCV